MKAIKIVILATFAATALTGVSAIRAARHSRAARPGSSPQPTEAAYVKRPKGTLTFTREVAPVVFKNCTTCHRPGEVAPFTLSSYEDVKKRASQIAAVTAGRSMPPWKADSHGEFHDERRLTTEEIGMIRQWADEGAKEGNKADLPPAPKYVTGWNLGKPDLVLEPAEPFKLAADGRDVYQCFVISNPNDTDRFLTSLEVRPDNRAVVHHVIAYLDSTGQGRKLDEKDPGPGYTVDGGGIGFQPSGFLGGWAPGNFPRKLPAGVGISWPKGSDIILQVHYHKSGKPETDRTKIGVYYCDGPVDKKLYSIPLVQPLLFIPAGKADHTVRAQLPVAFDATLLTVMPHMHLLGRTMTVSAKLPDGSSKQLINVPDWDFNWQNTYAYKEPLKLPKGTSVTMTASYDNSKENPRNPNNPPRMVTWGEQTTNEMCIAFLGFTVDSEHLTKGEVATGIPSIGSRRGRGERLRQLLTGQGTKP